MTRRVIQEPNFISFLWEARPGSGGYVPQSAELRIVLLVFLAPMDPSKPYNMGVSDGPWFYGPVLRQLFWPAKANLNFRTHLADTRQQVRKGTVTDGDDPPSRFKARSWTRREFEQFKADFKRVVELSWNNQIILLPPEDPVDGLSDDQYMAMVANPSMPAHVACSLEIQLVESKESAHAAIQVVHLDRDDDPSINRTVMPLPGEGEFRSYAWTICNEDVHRRTTTSWRWPSLSMSQIAAAHEIGHWLGRPSPLGDVSRFVDHIDEDKYSKTDPDYAELQYGGTAGHRTALMGGGSLATEYEAKPWLNRVRRHTGALFGWRFVHRLQFVGMVPVSARQKRLLSQAAAAPAASP